MGKGESKPPIIFFSNFGSRDTPPPCLEVDRGFWTPCRGRGVDLTPMSLIQLFVYFLGGDIFKTSIARLHPQNAASWLAVSPPSPA